MNVYAVICEYDDYGRDIELFRSRDNAIKYLHDEMYRCLGTCGWLANGKPVGCVRIDDDDPTYVEALYSRSGYGDGETCIFWGRIEEKEVQE